MEVVEDVGGRLSVILAGHPKLRNDLRRPTMEEIGYRTDIFNLDGIAGSQRDDIHWLPGVSTGNEAEPGDILTAEAIDMLATKLRTPLQVQLHLTLALEAGYQTGEKPVTPGGCSRPALASRSSNPNRRWDRAPATATAGS